MSARRDFFLFVAGEWEGTAPSLMLACRLADRGNVQTGQRWARGTAYSIQHRGRTVYVGRCGMNAWDPDVDSSSSSSSAWSRLEPFTKGRSNE
jgi:hypothetical protein